MTENELDSLFGAMPGMQTIRLVKDHMGRNKGYAYRRLGMPFIASVIVLLHHL